VLGDLNLETNLILNASPRKVIKVLIFFKKKIIAYPMGDDNEQREVVVVAEAVKVAVHDDGEKQVWAGISEKSIIRQYSSI